MRESENDSGLIRSGVTIGNLHDDLGEALVDDTVNDSGMLGGVEEAKFV